MPLIRDPSYARVESSDIDYFRGLLGDTGVITDSTALQALNQCVFHLAFEKMQSDFDDDVKGYQVV